MDKRAARKAAKNQDDSNPADAANGVNPADSNAEHPNPEGPSAERSGEEGSGTRRVANTGPAAE